MNRIESPLVWTALVFAVLALPVRLVGVRDAPGTIRRNRARSRRTRRPGSWAARSG